MNPDPSITNDDLGGYLRGTFQQNPPEIPKEPAIPSALARQIDAMQTLKNEMNELLDLIEQFNEGFFQQPREKVIDQYRRRMDRALGEGLVPVDHLERLHELGYLPIRIKALPEGMNVPIGVPVLTIENTLPEFFWLTNYLETVMSAWLWGPITSATVARHYRLLFEKAALQSGGDLEFVPFQGHDFSCRGMKFLDDPAASGAGHLTSFYGTDTVIAIDLLERYYGADADHEIVGVSVPATEHNVQSSGILAIEESLRRHGEWNGIKLEDL